MILEKKAQVSLLLQNRYITEEVTKTQNINFL